MTLTITSADAAAIDITFAPVEVKRGRKFRGFAYFLSSDVSGFYIYGGPGGYRETDRAKLWDPSTKRFVYATADFCEDVERPTEEVLASKTEYIRSILEDTLNWCKANSKNPDDENDVNRFARNVIRKRHAKLLPLFDKLCEVKDNRDLAAEIMKTVEWALTLRTQPGWVYHKWCEGGKMYAPKRYTEIIYRSLCKKRLNTFDGFIDVLNVMLDMHQLPHVEA